MLEHPTRDRPAERHEATRTEILDAAWQVARAEGLAALALRDIAQRVGMQAPSLYSYFESKNAIYDAMFAQGAAEFLKRDQLLVATGDPLRDLTAGLGGLAHGFHSDPARHPILFQRPGPAVYAP